MSGVPPIKLPDEMLGPYLCSGVTARLPGLRVADTGLWRIVAQVPRWADWSSAGFHACLSADVERFALRVSSDAAVFVSQPVFGGPGCSWPPIGVQPGALDFDWVGSDWGNRSPDRAVNLVAQVMASVPMKALGSAFSIVCSGHKGLHILYDTAVLDLDPRSVADEIRNQVPQVSHADGGLYLDSPQWFRRLPGTLNYREIEGVRDSGQVLHLDPAALADGRLRDALRRQWLL